MYVCYCVAAMGTPRCCCHERVPDPLQRVAPFAGGRGHDAASLPALLLLHVEVSSHTAAFLLIQQIIKIYSTN